MRPRTPKLRCAHSAPTLRPYSPDCDVGCDLPVCRVDVPGSWRGLLALVRVIPATAWSEQAAEMAWVSPRRVG